MSLLKTRKQRGYKSLILVLCALGLACTLGAQNEIPAAGEQEQTKELRKKVDGLLKNQEEETRIQSLSVASGERFLHRPVFQMESTFDGILPGLVVTPTSGYSTQQSSITLRGRDILVVVDGIPRSDANIPISQIESVSVIKDGLGLNGMGMTSGNGVVYIKTKRGTNSAMKIEFTGQLAFAQQIYRPNFLNSYEYSKLLNKALSNDGLPAMYSDQDIELYRTGASPYTHPNVDWFDVMTRKTVPIQQYNLNISGGNKIARYFVGLNMYDEAGFLRQDSKVNSYNTQESFEKYSLRANTDVNLTSTTLLNVSLFGQMFRETTPGNGVMGAIYPAMYYTPNNAYPVFNPSFDFDGKGAVQTFGGAPNYTNNIYAMSVYSGYILYPKTDFNIDVTLEHKFKDALKGLYVSGTYSYNSSYRESLTRNKKFNVHYYWKDPESAQPDTKNNFTQLQSADTQANKSSYSRQNRMQYAQLSAGYDFAIKENEFKTKLSYLYNDYNLQGTNLPLEKKAVNLMAEYALSKKYMAELNMTTMGLNLLKPGERWGIFPALGLGWNIYKEDWFAVSNIDKLKLRMSYGISGNDGTGSYYRKGTKTLENYYYTYMKYYNKKANGTVTGASPAGNDIYTEAGLPYLSKWEKNKRLNIGVDISAFNNKLAGTVEFFHNTYSDIMQKGFRSSNSMQGDSIPNENIGKYRQHGFEISLDYKTSIDKVNIYLNGNATAYWTKCLSDGGFTYPEAYMEQVGRPYNMIFGYVADGFFQSQEDIDEYTSRIRISDYIPQRGDIKYKDINGDGVLDGKDIKAIGTKSPRIDYGFYIGAEWNGLSISTQWSGVANKSIILMDTPFGYNDKNAFGQALVEHLDHWTPENPNAKYPRLSAVTNSNNERKSTFWLKKGDFLRLKNIELAYVLPAKWTNGAHLKKVKIFTNAYNLLTFTCLDGREPDFPSLIYNKDGKVPNVKAFNLGLNVQF
ncbi:MAG: SusC/RagA family TonB-linked outer membrane protein [Dysgonamonadaceae bacterium]